MHEVKFAVVREDPLTEARVLEGAKASSILLVASGGCTALSLKALEPRLEVVAYDGSPAQIAHAEAKNKALASIVRRAFNASNVSVPSKGAGRSSRSLKPLIGVQTRNSCGKAPTVVRSNETSGSAGSGRVPLWSGWGRFLRRILLAKATVEGRGSGWRGWASSNDALSLQSC